MLGALLGNYRVVEQLGEGGMGVVYLGRHETLGSRVVVKVLKPQMSRNAGMVQRFFNEAQAATAIRNPGIAQVFDFGTTPNGSAYFVMELLDGESLTARLKQGRLDYVECCRIARQIANVLQAAHAAGITHRDLKPDNLFLVPDAEVIGGERVKVLDFGIAKLTGDTSGLKTGTGMVMGTPNYMSPEQCRSARNAEPRSDIYSLGCILFKMACGRPPFLGHGLGDIVGGHLHLAPPHPQSLAPDMPDALAALIAKMLEKPPEARPQTMAEVSQVLDEVLATLDAQPQRVPTPLPVRVPTPLPGIAPVQGRPPAPLPVGPAQARPPTRVPVVTVQGRPPTPLPVGPAQARPPTPLPVVSIPEHTPPSEASPMLGDGSTVQLTDTSVSFLDTSVSTIDDGSSPFSPALTPPVRLPTPPLEPSSSTVEELATEPFSLALTPPPMLAPVPASRPRLPTAEELATKPFSTVESPPARAPTPLPVPFAPPLEDRAPAPSPLMARAPSPLPVSSAPPLEDRAPTRISLSSPPVARAPSPVLMTHAPPGSPRASTPPVAQLSPTSTTIRGPTPTAGTRPRRRALWPFVLGGLLCSGAGVAIALLLAGSQPEEQHRPDPDPKPAPALADAAVIMEQLPDAPPEAPDAVVDIVEQPPDAPPEAPEVVVDAGDASGVPTAADDLGTECQGYQAARAWADLEKCAEKLKSLDSMRGKELATRAAKETRSAPHITAVEAALRDKDLLRARKELDQVWSKSVDYTKIKSKYDAAENQAINDLAAQLEDVKDADCEEHAALLAKPHASVPTRVYTEAAGRIPCTPNKSCDARGLVEKGRQQYGDKRLAEALASFEASLACAQDPNVVFKALMVTCEQKDLPKAKSYWRKLPSEIRTKARPCEAFEAQLNAP